MFYYFNDIIKFEDFGYHNITLDEKSNENIFIFDVTYQTFVAAKSFHIRFHNIDGFIRAYVRSRYLVLFGPENMMLFTTRLHIL